VDINREQQFRSWISISQLLHIWEECWSVWSLSFRTWWVRSVLELVFCWQCR